MQNNQTIPSTNISDVDLCHQQASQATVASPSIVIQGRSTRRRSMSEGQGGYELVKRLGNFFLFLSPPHCRGFSKFLYTVCYISVETGNCPSTASFFLVFTLSFYCLTELPKAAPMQRKPKMTRYYTPRCCCTRSLSCIDITVKCGLLARPGRLLFGPPFTGLCHCQLTSP